MTRSPECNVVRFGAGRAFAAHTGNRMDRVADAAQLQRRRPVRVSRNRRLTVALAWRVQKWSLFCPEPAHSCRLLLGRVHTAAPSTRVPVYACRLLVAACHAAAYAASLSWAVRLRHWCYGSVGVVCFRPTAPSAPEHLGSTLLGALCTMRGGRPSGRGAGGVSSCADHA